MPRVEKFLFAEDARLEANGQITLVGFIPSDSIAMQRSGPFQLPKLTSVLVLSYMEGIANFSFQIEVSKGAEVIQRSPRVGQSRQPKPRFHTMVTAFTPFAAPGPGEYLFKASLDVSGSITSFSRKFVVEVADQASQPGSPPSSN